MTGSAHLLGYLSMCLATVLGVLLVLWRNDYVIPYVFAPAAQLPPPRGDSRACLPVPVHPWHEPVQHDMPGLLIKPENVSTERPWNKTEMMRNLHKDLCPGAPDLTDVDVVTFPDLLLIVDFNSPGLYGAIPYLELLYRQHFSDILYCGAQGESLKKFVDGGTTVRSVYYVEIPQHSWTQKYRCIEHAMRMCGHFTGYVLIGDDTLINIRVLRSLPKDKVLYGEGFVTKRAFVNITSHHVAWPWWNTGGGRAAMLGLLNELVFRSHQQQDHQAYEFLHRYYAYVNSSTIFYHMATDFLYVPSRLASLFLYMAELFRKHRVNVEVALPFFVSGLQHAADVLLVKMHSLWFGDRTRSEQFYKASPDILYLHPFKYSANFKTPRGKAFICEDYLHAAVD